MAGSGVVVIGLGPAGYALVDPASRELLGDPNRRVIARTLRHPAVAELAELRPVESGDDLYEAGASFEEVYDALAERVVQAGRTEEVIFAVPGSPTMGEFTVPRIRARAAAAGISVEVRGAASFVDAICLDLGIDPLEKGLQILDGRDLPDPLWLDAPTIIAQVDLPVVLADALSRLESVLPADVPVTVITDAGSPGVHVSSALPHQINPEVAGLRTSLFVDGPAGGLPGVISTMRRLRRECPWDREQTHHSIVSNLIEEAHELADALAALPPGAPTVEAAGDGAYGEVEEELGDVLLQVLFHVVMGESVGALRIDDVAETLRRKLVHRHPHVFGEAEAGTAEDVRRVWDDVKEREKPSDSLMDGVAMGVPSFVRAEKLQSRAARAGFDWPSPDRVSAKVREELDELDEAVADDDRKAIEAELGDLLFSVVNLARHLDADPEVALRRATGKFERRFRAMEAGGQVTGVSLDELERRWKGAKEDER